MASYKGKKFTQRATVLLEVALDRFVKKRLIAAAPKRSGLLSKKVKRKRGRRPAGHFAYVSIKSRAPHAGLVSKGHRQVTAGGEVIGFTAGNPYVSDVARANDADVVSFIDKNITKDGAEDTVNPFG